MHFCGGGFKSNLHTVKSLARDSLLEAVWVRSVSCDMLYSVLVVGIGCVGVIRDLESDWLLSSRQEGDFVTLLDQLSRQVHANESGSTYQQMLRQLLLNKFEPSKGHANFRAKLGLAQQLGTSTICIIGV